MRSALLFGFVAVSLLFGAKANALVEASPTPPPAAVVNPANPGTFDPAAATKAWLDTVPPEKRAKSDAYFEGGYWLILWNFLTSSAILLILLTTGWSARFRNWAERITRFKFLQVVIYSLLFTAVILLLGFPMEVYQNFFREHQYELSSQSFASWMGDQGWDAVVNFIGIAIGLSVLYAVFRRAPRLWWAFGVIAAIVLLGLAQMIAPVFIFPLFNKYQPLADASIRDPILALAKANEIPVDNVYEFNASKQTNRVSANVSGAFGTTRISLNDNLLSQCSLPEIRQVMSHEMGHYVLNHGIKLLIYTGISALVAFLFAKVGFAWALQRWGPSWDIRDIADVAGFPLLVLIFSVVSFIGTPVSNSMVRVTEREADAFGINACGEPDGFAQVSLKLGTYRKLNPGPLEEMIFFDHPSGRARIRMAMDWKAAHAVMHRPASQ